MRGRAGPMRTCIGCRKRADSSDLVRLVARLDGPAPAVVPDPQHVAPGRGAHLHPTTRCLDLAVRRRAFVRALRQSGLLDTTAVCDWVEQAGNTSGDSSGTIASTAWGTTPGTPKPTPTGAGSDAETEHQLMSPR